MEERENVKSAEEVDNNISSTGGSNVQQTDCRADTLRAFNIVNRP